MAVKIFHGTEDAIYYCTFTCFSWIHLFEITDFYNEIYNWFDMLTQKGCKIIAFVIMPNHCHFIVFVPAKEDISKLIGNGKRFMAYEIVRRLREKSKTKLLLEMGRRVDPNELKIGKKHTVFQPSFDAKPIYSEKFLLQKLDYIHHNPVTGRWNLAKDFTQYKHSSARFYELDEEGIYPVTHYKAV